jgi:LacI family transcriptional regulator
MRRATLKDVASQAGVSTATVARVLHNRGYVAQETREVVEAALAQTGYHINAIAQGLRRQRTYTVGHVLHSIIPNQFFAAVAEGVEEVSSSHDCGVLIVTTHGDPVRERNAVETLIQRRVDAIVFTTATHADNVRLAIEAEIPVVQVERKTSVETLSVTGDNFGGAYAATDHLVSLGHRHIGFIGVDPAAIGGRPISPTSPDVEQERISGYLEALRARNVPIDDTTILLESGYITESDAPRNRGYLPMTRLLDLPSPPTAVFVTFDLLAAGALQAIYERMLRIPEDVSIVGFDDTYAPYLTPPLTAVRNPMLEMGRLAAKLIFQQLEARDVAVADTDRRLPMELIVRGSTAPPGRSAPSAM